MKKIKISKIKSTINSIVIPNLKILEEEYKNIIKVHPIEMQNTLLKTFYCVSFEVISLFIGQLCCMLCSIGNNSVTILENKIEDAFVKHYNQVPDYEVRLPLQERLKLTEEITKYVYKSLLDTYAKVLDSLNPIIYENDEYEQLFLEQILDNMLAYNAILYYRIDDYTSDYFKILKNKINQGYSEWLLIINEKFPEQGKSLSFQKKIFQDIHELN